MIILSNAKKITFSKIYDKNFKVLSKQEFYQYLLDSKIINQEICGRCNKIIQFEHIRKITAQSVEYRFSNEKITCSNSCSQSLSNLKRHADHPELKGKGFENIIQGNYEERFGKEKADKIKKKQSDKHKGELNANFGGKYAKWGLQNSTDRKGISNIEYYGEERGKAINEKIKNGAKRGKDNHQYGKEAPIRSGNGISGYYKNFYFRSLLELSYMLLLENKKIRYEKMENNKLVNYFYNGSARTYSIDFYLPDLDQYIEVKAKNFLNSEQNKYKFEAARNQYGDKFVVLTEDHITRINKNFLIQLINNNLVKLDNKKLCNLIQPQ